MVAFRPTHICAGSFRLSADAYVPLPPIWLSPVQGMVTRNRIGGRPVNTPVASSVPTQRRVGVVLVDPLTMFRAALSVLLAAEPGIEVLAQAGSADDALAAVRRLRTKTAVVAIIGLELSGVRDAFWLIRSMRDSHPSLPILVTGSNVDGLVVSRALFVGADSFVHKDAEPRRFIEAIRGTAEGTVVLEGLPRGTFGAIAANIGRPPAAGYILTARETEVLTVAAEGLTARQIGRRLGVRERTVTTHLGRIYKKLGATSRVSAIALATNSGLLMKPLPAQSFDHLSWVG